MFQMYSRNRNHTVPSDNSLSVSSDWGNINKHHINVDISTTSVLIFATVPPDKSPPHLTEVGDWCKKWKRRIFVFALNLHKVVVEQVLQFEFEFEFEYLHVLENLYWYSLCTCHFHRPELLPVPQDCGQKCWLGSLCLMIVKVFIQDRIICQSLS